MSVSGLNPFPVYRHLTGLTSFNAKISVTLHAGTELSGVSKLGRRIVVSIHSSLLRLMDTIKALITYATETFYFIYKLFYL